MHAQKAFQSPSMPSRRTAPGLASSAVGSPSCGRDDYQCWVSHSQLASVSITTQYCYRRQNDHQLASDLLPNWPFGTGDAARDQNQQATDPQRPAASYGASPDPQRL